MDKTYQDIHLQDSHDKDFYVRRAVQILSMVFTSDMIEIQVLDSINSNTKTICLPKMAGFKLVID